MTDILNLAPFIAGCASLYLALVVLIAGKSLVGRLTFTVFALGMGIWGVFITLFLQSSNDSLAEIFAQVYYVAALTLAYGFLLFCLVFTAQKSRRKVIIRQSTILAVPVLALFTLIIMPDMFIKSVDLLIAHEVILQSIPYLFYAVIFMLYGGFSLALLISYMAKSRNPQKRRQIQLIAWVMIACLPAGAFFNLILPLMGNYKLIMIGPVFAVPIVIVVFYAIMRHSMFDIRLTVVRTLTYGFSLISLALIYYVLAYAFSVTLFQSTNSLAQDPASIGLALLLAFLFQPVRRFFDRLTNHIFYRENYSLDDFITRLSRKLSTTTDINDMLQQSAAEIAKTLKSHHVFFHVTYHSEKLLSGVIKQHAQIKDSDISVVRHFFEDSKQDIAIQYLLHDQTSLYHIMVRYKIQLIVPLWRNNELISCLFIGDKENSDHYVTHDIKTLLTVRDELVIAIQNALSYQEIKDFSITLQDRINEATAQLRRSNHKLQQLDEAKDEFISMASHQLRTPLTSVKGYLSMALEGDAGKLTPAQRKIIEEAYLSSQRMVYLIGDFLNVSRLKTGKFIVEYGDVNMAAVIDEEISQLKMLAATRNLTINYASPPDFPTSRLDAGKIRQAIMNLVDNAIYYSHENGAITLELTKHKNELTFTVTDQGIGVPLEDQKGLFEKFFRAKNGRRIRPDGTGIGLFMVKRVIDAHGGKIIFHSVEGKGSTFGFSVPLRTSEKKKAS